MSDDPRALYQAVVLEHSRHPRNEGRLEDATHQAKKTNPLCGDRVTVYARVVDGRIEAVRFEARGCAIAKASASLLTEAARGTSPDEARALGAALAAAVKGEEIALGALEPLRAVSSFPSRRRCATLAWETLAAALDG